MLQGLTVKELREALEQLPSDADNKVVVIGVNYGDRYNTIQVIPATDIGTASISESGYSESGYAIDNDDDDDNQQVITLNLSRY